MKYSKNIILREYIYGDFDKDRVKNIDDPYPFDKYRSRWPNANKNPSFYHKTQYGGFETKFSTVLLNIERHNERHAPSMLKVMQDNPSSSARVKTIPSTIEKLSKSGLENVHDVVGVSIPTINRKEAYNKSEEVKHRYKTNPHRYDDFYRHPKNGAYYAIHHEVLNPLPVEVQIASKPMRKLAKRTHVAYKAKKPMGGFIREGKRLFKLGF